MHNGVEMQLRWWNDNVYVLYLKQHFPAFDSFLVRFDGGPSTKLGVVSLSNHDWLPAPATSTYIMTPGGHKIEARTKAKAEFTKGTEMNVPYMLSSGEKYAKGRRQFIVPMLKALKILLGNGVASEDAPPALPAVNMFDAPQDSPEYEALVKKHEEEMEAHSRAILLLELWNWRVVLMQNVVGYYSQPPYATDELRQLATEILQDDAVVKEIMDRVAANIASPQGPIDQL